VCKLETVKSKSVESHQTAAAIIRGKTVETSLGKPFIEATIFTKVHTDPRKSDGFFESSLQSSTVPPPISTKIN
jgi:hypothetical protein